MSPKLFSGFAISSSSLVLIAYTNQHLLDIPSGTGKFYLLVTLPLLISFIPGVISLGSLYLSLFFHLLVKDEQSRSTVRNRIGFFIIEK